MPVEKKKSPRRFKKVSSVIKKSPTHLGLGENPNQLLVILAAIFIILTIMLIILA